MNALEELGYAFCRTCHGDIHPDDLIQGQCLGCWAAEDREETGSDALDE